MNNEIILNFNKKGQMKSLYNEEFNLKEFGKTSIKRASHVEPTKEGKWTANLTPVNGPILGPFNKRSEALKTEVDWINKNILTK